MSQMENFQANDLKKRVLVKAVKRLTRGFVLLAGPLDSWRSIFWLHFLTADGKFAVPFTVD